MDSLKGQISSNQFENNMTPLSGAGPPFLNDPSIDQAQSLNILK